MNHKKVINFQDTMNMIAENLDKSNREYFAERNKTVEEKMKEAKILYRIEGNHIIVEKPFNPEIVDSEYKRQAEDEDAKNEKERELEEEEMDEDEDLILE